MNGRERGEWKSDMVMTICLLVASPSGEKKGFGGAFAHDVRGEMM